MIEWINHTGEIWLPAFLWLSLQNTLFLCIIFLTLKLLQNTNAGIKYWLSFSGIIKLLLPPFIGIPLFLNSGNSNIKIGEIMVILSQSTQDINHINTPVLTLSGIVFLLWLSTLFFQIAFFVISAICLQKRLSDASMILPVFSKEIPVPVFQTNRISIPMTFGIFKPRIFVPMIWNQWSEECRKMIIQHEWAHTKKKR